MFSKKQHGISFGLYKAQSTPSVNLYLEFRFVLIQYFTEDGHQSIRLSASLLRR